MLQLGSHEKWCANRNRVRWLSTGRSRSARSDADGTDSILSSAKTYLTLVKDSTIAENSRRSDFRIITDLMSHERPLSLHILTPGGNKERPQPLVRLLLTMATHRLMSADLKYSEGQQRMPHRHRLLMVLDEFPSRGRPQIRRPPKTDAC